MKDQLYIKKKLDYNNTTVLWEWNHRAVELWVYNHFSYARDFPTHFSIYDTSNLGDHHIFSCESDQAYFCIAKRQGISIHSAE